jgi:hypothetical protein
MVEAAFMVLLCGIANLCANSGLRTKFEMPSRPQSAELSHYHM